VAHPEAGPSRAQISALEGLIAYRTQLDKAVTGKDWAALRRHARAIRGAAAQSDLVQLGDMVELCSKLIMLNDQELAYQAGSLCRQIGFEIDAISRNSNQVRFE
jgi:HPt (histidine-containing phosphotransfer) domain-containing protein